jgi:hypothetical protein
MFWNNKFGLKNPRKGSVLDSQQPLTHQSLQKFIKRGINEHDFQKNPYTVGCCTLYSKEVIEWCVRWINRYSNDLLKASYEINNDRAYIITIVLK